MTAMMTPTTKYTTTTNDSWKELAQCRSADPEIFLPPDSDEDESPYPPQDAMKFCDVCPVKAECLESALENNEPTGIWGGTTPYQRKLLKRLISRKSCPGCGARDVIVRGRGRREHEVCLACGVSWFI